MVIPSFCFINFDKNMASWERFEAGFRESLNRYNTYDMKKLHRMKGQPCYIHVTRLIQDLRKTWETILIKITPIKLPHAFCDRSQFFRFRKTVIIFFFCTSLLFYERVVNIRHTWRNKRKYLQEGLKITKLVNNLVM